MYSTFWKSLNPGKLRVVSAREYVRESPSTVRACVLSARMNAYTSAYYGYSINIMYSMYLKLRPTAFLFLCYYLHVARDALHANTLELSEPRVDARARACMSYTSISVCACVISAWARDEEQTRNPMHIQGLLECTIVIKGILGSDNIIQSSYMYDDSSSRAHWPKGCNTWCLLRKHLFRLGHSLIAISNANNLAPSNYDTFTHFKGQGNFNYLKIGRIRDVILYWKWAVTPITYSPQLCFISR